MAITNEDKSQTYQNVLYELSFIQVY